MNKKLMMNNSVSGLGGGLSRPDRVAYRYLKCWSVHCDLAQDKLLPRLHFPPRVMNLRNLRKCPMHEDTLGFGLAFHLEQLVIIPVALNSMITNQTSSMFLTAHSSEGGRLGT